MNAQDDVGWLWSSYFVFAICDFSQGCLMFRNEKDFVKKNTIFWQEVDAKMHFVICDFCF